MTTNLPALCILVVCCVHTIRYHGHSVRCASLDGSKVSHEVLTAILGHRRSRDGLFGVSCVVSACDDATNIVVIGGGVVAQQCLTRPPAIAGPHHGQVATRSRRYRPVRPTPLSRRDDPRRIRVGGCRGQHAIENAYVARHQGTDGYDVVGVQRRGILPLMSFGLPIPLSCSPLPPSLGFVFSFSHHQPLMFFPSFL